MTVRISKTSKLDNVKSWSLQALETCPGSLDENGELVDACSGCYATTGNYAFPNVKEPRAENKQDWRRPEWVADMTFEMRKAKWFRWFDSGDMYSLELANKIKAVMEATPNTQHWLPTRMAKFVKFQPILKEMDALPNVKVRFSSDSITGEFTSGLHGSVIIPDAESAPAGVTVCEAYDREGKCSSCRACYSKDIDVIAYPQHGRKMRKVFRLMLETA
jgi:hypothetical protein